MQELHFQMYSQVLPYITLTSRCICFGSAMMLVLTPDSYHQETTNMILYWCIHTYMHTELLYKYCEIVNGRHMLLLRFLGN